MKFATALLAICGTAETQEELIDRDEIFHHIPDTSHDVIMEY